MEAIFFLNNVISVGAREKPTATQELRAERCENTAWQLLDMQCFSRHIKFDTLTHPYLPHE